MRVERAGLVAIVAAALVLSACSGQSAAEGEPDPVTVAASAEQTPTYLFTISAQGGTIEGVGEDTGDEELTLTLIGANDHATQFADRPIRDAYVLSTRDLVDRWDGWFADAPPNAVLSYSEPGDSMPRTIVMQLSEPVYDESTRTLAFAARHLHRQPDLSPDAQERIEVSGRVPPATFTRGALFIDSVEGDPDSVAIPSASLSESTGTPPSPGSSMLPLPLSSLQPAEPSPSESSSPTGQAAKTINGCVIEPNTDCRSIDLVGADLRGADLRGAGFFGANLGAADLSGADLSGADLRGAQLLQTKLDGANLTGANLEMASMAETSAIRADFSGARLYGAFMLHANLQGAMLVRANLRRATPVSANLTGANLLQADLSGADLEGASLWGAELGGANLSGAEWYDGRICAEGSFETCR
jgi:uncharacterized protein YjbI with pentapeptide repeats